MRKIYISKKMQANIGKKIFLLIFSLAFYGVIYSESFDGKVISWMVLCSSSLVIISYVLETYFVFEKDSKKESNE